MSLRIMIVEDEEPLLELLRYNFESAGYEVETVAHGEEAETRLKEQVPDVLVLDWMLPKVSGIEVCRRLRQRNETRNLPIIMLTARGEESDRIRGLDTGADDYVVKPFSMTELVARVRAVLRRIRPGLAEDRVRRGEPTHITFRNLQPDDLHDFQLLAPDATRLAHLFLPALHDVSYTFVFHQEGLFPFACTLHPPVMSGQILVLPPAAGAARDER